MRDGVLERLAWLSGADEGGLGPGGTLILPGLVDLHAHLREPGNEDAETVATGLAAAAHGGFTTVAAMPNTTPALDEPSVLARMRDAASASGSPVRLLAHGAVTTGRKGETLSAMGELADAGVVGFSDDGSSVRSAAVLRNALAYAGALGLPIIDHPEDETAHGRGRGVGGLCRHGARPQGLAGGGRGGLGRPVDRDPRGRGPRRARRAAAPHARLHGRGAGPCAHRQGRRPAGHLRRHAAPPRARRRVDRGGAALGLGGARR